MYTPKKLHWEESLATGDEALDFQHKYLFETFNKLGDAILSEEGSESVSVILGRLKFYAEWHFEKEEDCMHRHQCPAAGKNKQAHRLFIDMFDIYYEEYHQGGNSLELAVRIHSTLSDWLLTHVSGLDTKLRPYIHKE